MLTSKCIALFIAAALPITRAEGSFSNIADAIRAAAERVVAPIIKDSSQPAPEPAATKPSFTCTNNQGQQFTQEYPCPVPDPAPAPTPQHRCWDGQMKWNEQECPPHAVCSDGSWKHSADQCPQPQHRCWDGQMKWNEQECPPHAVCSDGSWKHSADQCPQPQHKCWDGQMKWRSEECPPHAVCADGSWKHSADQCPQPQHKCWDGQMKWRSEECPPHAVCSDGSWKHSADQCPQPQHQCWNGEKKWRPEDCPPKKVDCLKWGGAKYADVREGTPCPKYDCLGLDGKPYAQANAGQKCVPKLIPCNDARGKFYQNVNDGQPCPPVQFHFRRIDRKRQGDYSTDVDIDYIHDQHFEELCGKELDACKLRCKELGSKCLGFAYLREEKCCRFKNRLTRPHIFRAAGVTFYERFASINSV